MKNKHKKATRAQVPAEYRKDRKAQALEVVKMFALCLAVIAASAILFAIKY